LFSSTIPITSELDSIKRRQICIDKTAVLTPWSTSIAFGDQSRLASISFLAVLASASRTTDNAQELLSHLHGQKDYLA